MADTLPRTLPFLLGSSTAGSPALGGWPYYFPFVYGPTVVGTVTAVLLPPEQKIILGSVARLDATNSSTSTINSLTYTWSIIQTPIGSRLYGAQVTPLEADKSVVNFIPDVVGIYVVQLKVSDSLSTAIVYAEIEVRRISVPYHHNYTPDAGFIWSFLSDTWGRVEGRQKVETIWSAFIQAMAAEYLKLFEADYNKSIQNIQSLSQRRWMNYSSRSSYGLDEVIYKFGPLASGTHADTLSYNSSHVVVPASGPVYSIHIPNSEAGNIAAAVGNLIKLGHQSFTIRRVSDFDGSSVTVTTVEAVPPDLQTLPWEIPNLNMVVTGRTLELEGVTPGDVLSLRISIDTNNASAVVPTTVVAVVGEKVGVYLDPTKLSEALTGLGGSSSAVPGSGPLYSPADLILLGGISVRLHPFETILTSRIPLPEATVSIPFLQEYVKQPDIVVEDDGTFSQVVGDQHIPVGRQPYLLVENLDYVIDQGTIPVTVTFTPGSNSLQVVKGWLVERSIKPGDSVEIYHGAFTTTHLIRRVINSNYLDVYPALEGVGPQVTLQGWLKRKIKGTYAHLQQGTLIDVPKRWWAEISFLDNNPIIEKNFGSLVGVSVEEASHQLSQAPYLSVVKGLMYGLTKGPTLTNLRLAAQLLVGLPVALRPGIVREIQEDYVVRNDGTWETGRLLISVVDKNGLPTGQIDVYLYPQGLWVLDPLSNQMVRDDPTMAGLAVNPATGAQYAVGDSVTQFAPLSRGVLLEDYLSDPVTSLLFASANPSFYVSRYHAFTMSVNADVVAVPDIDLAARFLQFARPSYERLLTVLFKRIADSVSITDAFYVHSRLNFFDHVALGLPTAVKYDYATLDPSDFVTVDGKMYYLVKQGTDLVTVALSSTVTSAAGGFTPAAGLLYSGALLVIYGGPNANRYEISSVTDNTHLVLATTALVSASNQKFALYQLLDAVQLPAQSITTALSQVTVSQAFSAGIMSGDSFGFYSAGGVISKVYTVLKVVGTTVYLDKNVAEATATYTPLVWRDPLLTNSSITGLSVTFNGATATVGIVSGNWQKAPLIRKGHYIYRIATGTVHEIVDWVPSTKTLSIFPSTTSVGAESADIRIPSRGDGPGVISLDVLDRIPAEQLSLVTSSDVGVTATTTAGSPDITAIGGAATPEAMGVRPGDFFVVNSGADQVDIGYGTGLYPILAVSPGGITNKITLTRNLTTNATLRFGFCRRRLT